MLCVITFLSAFLLFQIELIVAKLFLPSYGGSYLVWGACVVFFQAVLLAGYVFAHYLIKRFGIKTYLKLHIALLFLPFLFFPGHNIHVNDQAASMPLVLDIFVRLFLTIGPVFFILSTVSLVTQSWLAASKLQGREHPYMLYAVSNIGSFAALWTYPFIFEYFMTNTEQLNIWRVAYVVLAVLNILCLYIVGPLEEKVRAEEKVAPVTRGTALRWLCLSAGSVALFLSVTNIITYEVAPVPLLWILPLSIYLLSFVLAFKNKPLVPRWMNTWSVLILVLAMALYVYQRVTLMPAAWAIILFSTALFFLCLHAQNELIKSKPAPGNMTFFYVMISLGGFLGGFVTSWIVPLISRSPVEFLLGVGLLALAYSKKSLRIILIGLLLAAVVFDTTYKTHTSLIKKRNYYGIYDAYDKNGVRTFLHGTTLHGLEWTDQRRMVPLGYYSPLSPLGEVFIKDIFSARRVGAFGLGAGTIAMYAKPDMPMDFYELDPDVVKIAAKHFYYLNLAPGPVKVAIGDARISLAKSGLTYDVLVIDAFGGDSIPFHLINRDVVKLYREHLTSHGGILFHIPNRYFDLEPIVARIAQDLGGYVAFKEAKQDGITMRTFWAVITWDQERFIRLVSEEGWRLTDLTHFKPMATWTDDFSTVLPILKLDDIVESLKQFKRK